MAWVLTAISGDELAAYNLDRPILLGSHLLREQLDPDDEVNTNNFWTLNGTIGSTDDTDTDFPAHHAYDSFGHIVTRPNAFDDVWFYMALLSDAEFDTVVVLGKNLDEADGVRLEISDSDDFATRRADVFNVAGANRIVITGPNRLTGVTRIRLRISGTALKPQLTELWLGRRQQLLFHPDLPWDNQHEQSFVRGAMGSCGIQTPRTDRSEGAVRSPSLTLGSVAELAVVTNWWSDIQEGAQSFCWIEDPSSDPTAYLMSLGGPAVDFNPLVNGPVRRNITIPMTELDPYRAKD